MTPTVSTCSSSALKFQNYLRLQNAVISTVGRYSYVT